ncbi:UDP-GalNAc:beta-1,3-N-acetylgalactosaminyltransferase 1 isoform X3 [Desmodus rotundus]|uniref:UDP-GalNAc:beta-1, 3-N-acetylgalactosaminyltransferase 1 isoform X3 n=1 Tax=Desmodus rotundus TaxID=9430 RepID=UPI001E1C168A|nr:UDP-GalNAc:beta-1,3-N-acetylgalactosaminyltransferase 1 isoform X3 [Desmodus rotundus]
MVLGDGEDRNSTPRQVRRAAVHGLRGAPGPRAWSGRARPCGCASARGAGKSAAARDRLGNAQRAGVPSKSVLIKAWETENNKELQLVLWSHLKCSSFPSVFGSGCPVASSHRLLCHGILSESPPLSAKSPADAKTPADTACDCTGQ